MRRRRTKKITTTSSNKYVLAGLTLSSALVFSRPIIPAIAYATDANKYIWTKQGLDLIGGESINKAASSANGSSLIASSFDFSGNDPDEPYPLYVSGNYGTNWQNVAEAADPGVANYWISVDISNDGQTMVAISTDGYDLDGGEGQRDIPGKVVLSRNAGASWSDITPDIPLENGGESFVVVSGDGSTIAATNGDSGGEVYITEDGGTNWVTQVPVGGEGIYPTSLSISDNGDKLLMSGMAGSGSEFDSVYITEDGGTNWTGINPFTTDMYIGSDTAMSADGNAIAVAGFVVSEGGEGGETTYEDHIYTSGNDGQTWSDVTPADDTFNVWSSIDMSDDGETVAVFGVKFWGGEVIEGGEDVRMYVSGDSGANWTEEDPSDREAGSVFDFGYGSTIDLNATGSRVIIGRYGGIYTGIINDPTVRLTDAQAGKPVIIATPDGTSITCSSAFKESTQAKQDSSYSYPLGLVDFCFDTGSADNQVTLTFVTDLKPNEVKARKYNSTNQTYFDIPNATITQTTYQNQPALALTYTITDNGQLDLDPVTGSIKDPVGLAVVGELANTGQSQIALVLLVALLTAPTLALIIQRRRSLQ